MKLACADLRLNIKENAGFSIAKASLMHGALMEWLPSEYADRLHHESRNPYSQFLQKIQGDWHWKICTFDEEAYEKIYQNVMDPSRDKLLLTHNDLEIGIAGRVGEVQDSDELLNQYYFQDAPRTITVRFLTPTSFKQQGKYLIYPDLRCVFQSMILKYDAVTVQTGETDETVLEELVRNTSVKQYRLKSSVYLRCNKS